MTYNFSVTTKRPYTVKITANSEEEAYEKLRSNKWKLKYDGRDLEVRELKQ